TPWNSMATSCERELPAVLCRMGEAPATLLIALPRVKHRRSLDPERRRGAVCRQPQRRRPISFPGSPGEMAAHERSYTSGIGELPLLGLTIGDMFDRIAAQHPGNEALVSRHQGLRYTYAELKVEVDRCARALIGLGVEKGQRVGIWAPNCAEWA